MIYFISDGKGAIKIGVTNNIKRRILQLRGGNPGELSLIGSIEGDARAERTIHAELKAHRLSGEWFADCDGTRAVIKRCLRDGVPCLDDEIPETYYGRPDFGTLQPIKIEIDPYRLERLDAELALVVAERKHLERTLAAIRASNRVMDGTTRTESRGAAAPDAGGNAATPQIPDVR